MLSSRRPTDSEVQKINDLEKPWAALASPECLSPHSPQSQPLAILPSRLPRARVHLVQPLSLHDNPAAGLARQDDASVSHTTTSTYASTLVHNADLAALDLGLKPHYPPRLLPKQRPHMAKRLLLRIIRGRNTSAGATEGSRSDEGRREKGSTRCSSMCELGLAIDHGFEP